MCSLSEEGFEPVDDLCEEAAESGVDLTAVFTMIAAGHLLFTEVAKTVIVFIGMPGNRKLFMLSAQFFSAVGAVNDLIAAACC